MDAIPALLLLLLMQVEKVTKATEIVKKLRPDLKIEGERSNGSDPIYPFIQSKCHRHGVGPVG